MAHGILHQKLKEIEPDADFDIRVPLASSSSGKRYFAKTGSVSDAEQFKGEAESLKLIYAAAPGLAPKLLVDGVDDDGRPYLISEYLNMTSHSSSTLDKLAERLAGELHACTSDKGFGFEVPTFCGATRLGIGWFETWEECYDALIGGIENGLARRRGRGTLIEQIGKVRQLVIPRLLHNLDVKPVLLHGDLWSGNTGVNRNTKEPVVFDPSSYFGHNEADLAIARIFGGFPSSFFNKYHSIIPKTEPVDEYEMRVDLYEVFHYLNHALLFGGGGYASSASEKMDRLLRYCTK